MTTDNHDIKARFRPTRRSVILAGASLGLMGLPAIGRAQSTPTIRIGYWPIAAGLPFYAAVEKVYFKAAGLDVEPIKFASAASCSPLNRTPPCRAND